MMKKIYILLLPILFLNCKQNVTDSNEIIGEVKVIKTPREMTWTADTLISPDPTSFQLLMNNILAFSSKDIWICGWCDVARGLMWHYDGKKWVESNIAADVGGMRVDDIAGYSSSDLWGGGYSGENIFLAHYNGQHWTRESDMGIKGELLDMCKDPSGNLWACGRNGIVLKFDKTKWLSDTIKINFPVPTEYFLKRIEFYDDKIYILATTVDKTTHILKYYYISGDFHKWTVADSMAFDSSLEKVKWGNWGLYSSSFNKLYSFGDVGCWNYDKQTWQVTKSSISTIRGMCGINDNYLFAVGNISQFFFYDGNKWENLFSLLHSSDSNFVFNNIWTDGYETFLIGYGTYNGEDRTIIYHGK